MRNLKRVLALALALVMVIGMMVMGASAASTTEYDYTEAQAIATGSGIFVGDDKGELNWTETLTREQAAKIMAYIMLGETTAEKLVSKTQNFTDVATNRWSAKYIEYCVNAGLIAGRGDGTFDPEGELTGLAFAKLLLVALGYDADAEGYVGANWATAIAVDAIDEGLDLEEVTLYDTVNRQQAAQMLLQVLRNEMVEYLTVFDKATGADTLVGPYGNDAIFGEELMGVKYVSGGRAMWGRPIDYRWVKGTKTLYTQMKEKVAEYTEAVAECDIAEDLGLDDVADITYLAVNNIRYTTTKTIAKNVGGNKDAEITPLATKAKIGAQGRLVEIYDDGNDGYEIVMIDTYLAQVTDVTEVEYDRNGHLEEYAGLTLAVFNVEDGTTATEYTKYAASDWDYEVGEWLLVYVDQAYDDEEEYVPYIYGDAEYMVGAQTAYTTVETHEVEDVEYDDSHTFYLDMAGNSTADHTWFFDQYGNLIGVIDIAAAPATYGVISSIYWRDSYDGEGGYARVQITYMDGESEWLKVVAIGDVDLYGVEGKLDEGDAAKGAVSSTKQYNKTDWTNKALYELVSTKAGLTLVETAEIEGNLTVNQKTLVEDEAYANSKTMFLAYNSTKGTYTTFTGVKNMPSYKNAEITMWVAEIDDETGDTTVEYVFVVDPATKGSKSDVDTVLYYGDYDDVTVKTNLEDNVAVSYTIRGGSIDDIVVEAGEETVYTDNDLVKGILNRLKKNGIMVLTITDGVVTKAQSITEEKPRELDGDLTVACAGVLGTDCEYEADDETLFYDSEWYAVEDAELVGASSWKAAAKAGKTVYIVYDEDLNATLVYFA